MNGKQPDFRVSVQLAAEKAASAGGRKAMYHPIGAAWVSDSGVITIRFHPLIDLSRIGPQDHVTLYPLHDIEVGQSGKRPRMRDGYVKADDAVDDIDTYGDKIPF